MKIAGETLVFIAILIVVLIFSMIFFAPNFKNLKNSFVNSIFGKETIPDKLEKDIKETTYIADTFLSEFESCIKSNTTDCYCPFGNTFIPQNMKLAFVNSDNNITFAIYPNKEDLCDTPSLKPVKTKELVGSIYVEDVYGKPSVKANKLINNDFSKATAVLISGNELCSAKDVSGSDKIDFSSGILYKLDKNKIAFTRSREGLKRC